MMKIKKRTVSGCVITIFTFIVCISFAMAADAFAEDGEIKPDLTVQYGEKSVGFTVSDLENLGVETHDYSGFNAWPTPRIDRSVRGVSIEKILKAAEIDIDDIHDDQLIRIVAGDDVYSVFLKKQLLCERYCFPNIKNEAGRAGKSPLGSSWKGKTPVPAMIGIDTIDNSRGRLYFGQTSPTEQTMQSSLRYMLEGNGGKIIIEEETDARWNAIKSMSLKPGTFVKKGQKVTPDRSINNKPTFPAERYWVYYTTDGTEPTTASEIYNYNNFSFGSLSEKFNLPAISKEGAMTIKTKVIGYGADDSAVTTFKYTGYTIPAKPKIKKITAKKKALKLQWTKVKGVTGYKIYRATKKKGKYKLVKTIKKAGTTTWTNKKLKKKKIYYYKIRTYKAIGGKTFYSGYSAVKYKKTK